LRQTLSVFLLGETGVRPIPVPIRFGQNAPRHASAHDLHHAG